MMLQIDSKAKIKILKHEMHHIWQSRSMGDSFLSNYLLQGVLGSIIGGGMFGIGNYFEAQAYGHDWFR